MKRILAILLCAVLLTAVYGCAIDADPAGGDTPASPSPAAGEPFGEAAQSAAPVQIADKDGEIIDITEKMYVAYINEIYVNTDDYLGKTLRIEGMYTASDYEGTTYYYVYRVGPGCCGNDGSMCGFEFTYDGEMPKDNDWVRVTGTLESYEEGGFNYLTIKADCVEVLPERGAEVVSQ